MCDATCSIDIQAVRGVKNVLFGGEGLFHTIVTGPGRIVLQTMPVSGFAAGAGPLLPHRQQLSLHAMRPAGAGGALFSFRFRAAELPGLLSSGHPGQAVDVPGEHHQRQRQHQHSGLGTAPAKRQAAPPPPG